MAHAQQFFYVQSVKQFLPEYFEARKVLEIGSLNINGSVRQFFAGCDYTGLDVGEGRDVDLVCPGQDHAVPAETYDTIITCEMMEHNPAWRRTWLNMLRMVKPDGLVLMTCATIGRRQHGTDEYTPSASPLTVAQKKAHYRNLGESDFTALVQHDAWFAEHAYVVDHESHDLSFFGVGLEAGDATKQRARQLKAALNQYYHDKNILGKY